MIIWSVYDGVCVSCTNEWSKCSFLKSIVSITAELSGWIVSVHSAHSETSAAHEFMYHCLLLSHVLHMFKTNMRVLTGISASVTRPKKWLWFHNDFHVLLHIINWFLVAFLKKYDPASR